MSETPTQVPGEASAAIALATEKYRAGHVDEARALLSSVVERDPANRRALFQLGIIALERREPAQAEAFLRRAIEGMRSAVGSMALGDALEAQGRNAEAEDALRDAVAIDAGLAEAWGRLASLYATRKARDEAQFALAAALRIRPRDARYWSNLASLQLDAKRYPEAVEAARRAVEFDPAHVLAWTHLGRALGSMGDLAGANRALTEAITRDSTSGPAQYWLAVSHAHLGHWSEAASLYRRAIACFPEWVEPRVGLANALSKLGRRKEAVAAFEEAAPLDASWEPAIWSQRLFTMQLGDDFAPADVSAAHREWARRFAASVPRRTWPRRDPAAKVRIGYVSPRFQGSSMAFALLPVLEAHDRSRFEIACYAELEKRDATGERFRALADHWVETQALEDDALARRIEDDGIDILVDLAGHTPGNRLAVFARRPARAAVSWLDYFNTTGVEAIDALVADDGAMEAGLAKAFVERLEGLGPVRYVYRAPDYAPEVTAPRAAAIVFGSFARYGKVTSSTLDAWSAILAATPGSRLLLKNDTLGEAAACAAVREEFLRRGIDSVRLELRGPGSHEEMLLELAEVDVVLDTFPYNGGITTLEALWMGRPVVSLAGDTLVGRQGASILGAVGLADLVARDPAHYIEVACALAADAPRRARLSASLRNALSVSPLGDAKAFTHRLESLYLRLLAEAQPN
ncbi:tetratricopeptide repeat protein [Usitatibacter rugosus]|uniref:O-linked N-acetylglucosamine transferase, SPINDLY family protein n=1 Tax=Usitatibacter rugosus TaxID=2732067 RepID=UPI001489AB20|nr:tetratricopeptide repeat protein [Usitatibacter rugosus]